MALNDREAYLVTLEGKITEEIPDVNYDSASNKAEDIFQSAKKFWEGL